MITLLKARISKLSHILRSWGLELQYMIGRGDTIYLIALIKNA